MTLPYVAPMPSGGTRQYGGQPHFGVWHKDEGRFVTIHKGRSLKVHRLICEAFNGSAPSPRSICMHLDENAANNRPSNLVWGTQKQNLNAPAFIEYCKARRGEDSPWIKGRIAASMKDAV